MAEAAADRHETWRHGRRAVKEAKILLGEARRILRKHTRRITPQAAAEVRAAIVDLEAALEAQDIEWVRSAARTVEDGIDRHLSFGRKSTLREYAESIGVAVLIELFLRSFVVEAFKIPSGSMIPTLQVGDHIFVNKYLYGVRIPGTDFKFFEYRTPRRGEVVVFRFPNPQHEAGQEDKDFIKRIVAVGGDVVEIRDRVLYVNGRPVPRQPVHPGQPCSYIDSDEGSGLLAERRCQPFQEDLGGHRYTVYYDPGSAVPRNWAPRRIPPHNVFVMGDNRDNSNDSRFWGTVNMDLIKGRAMFIWWSWGQDGVRWDRMFSRVQ